MPPQPQPPPPKPQQKPSPSQTANDNGTQTTAPNRLTVSSGRSVQGEKVVLFSIGGAGKTSLCASIADLGIKPLFIDVGDSTSHIDVARVIPSNFDELRCALHDDALLQPYGAIVLDDMTASEEFALDWVLRNIPHEKGTKITGIESYGWGKGFIHLYEASLLVLSDLDRIARMGKHVLVTAHDTIEEVKNPIGENYLQHQPRLRSNKNARFREKILEWSYTMAFIDFDVSVTKDGKAQGAGTRTIYPNPMPTHWAKSRTLADPIPYALGDSTFWSQLLALNINL